MGIKRRSLLAVGVTATLAGGAVGGIALASGNSTKLRAELSGQNEVPEADLDGSGRAKVEFWVDGEELCFSVRIRDTGTPNRGHIHVGVAGVNGGIVVPLFELVGAPADRRHDDLEDDGRLEDCVAADPAVLAQIAANPAGYYVNLHNARFPAGAIRGQLG